MKLGLDGVVVVESALSEIDGERGRLCLRGHPVEQLVAERGFEEVCALLWDGRLPDAGEARCLRRSLGAARVRAFDELWNASGVLHAADPMDALQGALACLPASDRPARAGREGKLRILATVSVVAAAWWRRRQERELIAPDPSLSHAEDWLRVLGVEAQREVRARALDALLVALIEHGLSASAFVARVVASTRADLVSALVAALAALKGPLHGGGAARALVMLDAIGRPERAPAWLRSELAAGRMLVGFGHPIYRTRDPRAAALENAAARLERSGLESRHLALARVVEREGSALLAARHPRRCFAANVDLYAAVLLDAVGLAPELFTPALTVARSAGWLAHAEEQRADGQLLRPRQRYVGPPAPEQGPN